MEKEFYNVTDAHVDYGNINLVQIVSSNLKNNKIVILDVFSFEQIAQYEYEEDFLFVRALGDKHNNIFILNKETVSEEEYIIDKVENNFHTTLGVYDYIEYGIEDGTYAIRKDGLYGFIDEDGMLMINPQYEQYNRFSEGVAPVFKDGHWNIINKSNEVLAKLPKEVDFVSYSVNGILIIRKSGKYGTINKFGETIIPCIYDSIAGTLVSDLKALGVYNGEKWGFVDLNGAEITPFIYDNVDGTEQENYIVYKGDKVGSFCSVEQKEVIPCEYDEIEYFYNHTTVAKKGEKYGVIDKRGRVVLGFDYDRIHECYKENYYILYKGKMSAIADLEGNIVVDFMEGRISFNLKDGFFVLKTFGGDFPQKIYDIRVRLIKVVKGINDVYNLWRGKFLIEDSRINNMEVFRVYDFNH